MSTTDLSYKLGFPHCRTPPDVVDFPSTVDRREFWRSMSNSGTPYDPRTSRSLELHPPELRVIHGLLTSTITGCYEIGGIISTIDLMCLYCMLHDVKPHMGALIAGLFHRQSQHRVKSIYAGPYITRVLSNMGYADRFVGMQVVKNIALMMKIVLTQRKKTVMMRMVLSTLRGCRLRLRDNRPVDETQLAVGHAAEESSYMPLPTNTLIPTLGRGCISIKKIYTNGCISIRKIYTSGCISIKLTLLGAYTMI
ncbi:unnamed protein product [Cuscuta epithymum]|uniref:Uncharacterized protein n=1 Tax=Cuscuta epithymum TaxID=186058 RepID=A0AAV0G176_9ASTE|nr:unnamed protein product [Cuscuta epithymum]